MGTFIMGFICAVVVALWSWHFAVKNSLTKTGAYTTGISTVIGDFIAFFIIYFFFIKGSFSDLGVFSSSIFLLLVEICGATIGLAIGTVRDEQIVYKIEEAEFEAEERRRELERLAKKSDKIIIFPKN